MFTGPDGVQYRWALGAMGMGYPKVSLSSSPVSSTLNNGMKLVTNDEKKTVMLNSSAHTTSRRNRRHDSKFNLRG